METNAVLSFPADRTSDFYSGEVINKIAAEVSKEAMDAAVSYTVVLCNSQPPFNDTLSASNSKMMMIAISKALFLYLLLRHLELAAPRDVYEAAEIKILKGYQLEYKNTLAIMRDVSKRMNVSTSDWFNPLSHLRNFLKADENGKIQGSPFKLIAKIIEINFFDESETDGSDQERAESIAYDTAKNLFSRIEKRGNL